MRGGAATVTPRAMNSGDGLPMPHGSMCRIKLSSAVVGVLDRELEVDAQLGNEIVLGERRRRRPR